MNTVSFGMLAKDAKRRRSLFLLPVVLLLCFGLFSWAAYTFLPKAANTIRREIVNDDYSTLTEPLAAGGEIRQQMQVKGKIYGVILNVATFNRVARGTLHVQLYAANGQLLATGSTDMTQLLDNTFHRFLFDAAVDGGTGASYTLLLTTTPESAADVLAFHRSSGPARDFVAEGEAAPRYPLAHFTLSQNGQPVDGTLALQYVTRYAGGFVVRAFSLFAAVLTLLVLTVFALLFVFRVRVTLVFAVSALVLGTVFACIISPPSGGEVTHLANTYHYSNRLLGTTRQDTPGQLTVRAADAAILQAPGIDMFTWQDMAHPEPLSAPANDYITIPAHRDGTLFLLYLPQILGITLARLLGLGTLPLLLMGRLAGLLAYTFITVLAIRRLPIAKPLLAGVALLPASLQLAASFSSAGLALCLVFSLVATCVAHTTSGSHLAVPQVILLGLLSALAAAHSALLLPVLLLPLTIPTDQYPTKRFSLIARASIVLAGLLGCISGISPVSANLPGNFPATANAATAPNSYWLKTLLAGTWGQSPIAGQLNWLFLVVLLGLVFALSIPGGRGKVPTRPTRLAAGAAFALCAATAAIWGATFLLPGLLLLLVALYGQNLRFRQDVSRPLLFWLVALVALIQLDAFTIILLQG